MRVIVTGAVAWSDEAAIRRALERLPRSAVIIHGDCAGADEIASRVAAEIGLTVQAMAKTKEDYRRFGKAAWKGLNERMLATAREAISSDMSNARDANSIVVLVFHPDLGKSQGARHMIDLAEAAGVPWEEPVDAPPCRDDHQ